jgi:hypothetical protein
MSKLSLAIALILLTVHTYGQTYSSITYETGTTVDIGSNADVCANDIFINGTFSGGGTICTGPLPVTLSSFNYFISENNVVLQWVTETEVNNSGFDVERKAGQQGSTWQKIGFVQGSGTTNEQKKYLHEDKKLQTGTYSYRIKQIDYNGNFEYFELFEAVNIKAPAVFSLSQNYPNPSNPRSKIDFQIPFDSKVKIIVYDMLGKEVSILADEFKKADFYSVEFDGSNLASGVYFYRIFADGILNGKNERYSGTMKLILVR